MSWDIAAQTGAGVAQDINRTACSDLDALLALAGSLVPGLDGRIGPVSGDIRPGADNRAAASSASMRAIRSAGGNLGQVLQ